MVDEGGGRAREERKSDGGDVFMPHVLQSVSPSAPLHRAVKPSSWNSEKCPCFPLLSRTKKVFKMGTCAALLLCLLVAGTSSSASSSSPYDDALDDRPEEQGLFYTLEELDYTGKNMHVQSLFNLRK